MNFRRWNNFDSYQKTVPCYQARFGVAYPVPFFHRWLVPTNAANVITTNDNEKQTVNQTAKNFTNSESFDEVQTTKSRIKWNYGQTSTLIHFWKNNIDNIESPISNNIWAEIKLKVDKQRPTKTIKQCKAKLRLLKDAYKKG